VALPAKRLPAGQLDTQQTETTKCISGERCNTASA
jgi:hypothetical protein